VLADWQTTPASIPGRRRGGERRLGFSCNRPGFLAAITFIARPLRPDCKVNSKNPPAPGCPCGLGRRLASALRLGDAARAAWGQPAAAVGAHLAPTAAPGSAPPEVLPGATDRSTKPTGRARRAQTGPLWGPQGPTLGPIFRGPNYLLGISGDRATKCLWGPWGPLEPTRGPLGPTTTPPLPGPLRRSNTLAKIPRLTAASSAGRPEEGGPCSLPLKCKLGPSPSVPILLRLFRPWHSVDRGSWQVPGARCPEPRIHRNGSEIGSSGGAPNLGETLGARTTEGSGWYLRQRTQRRCQAARAAWHLGSPWEGSRSGAGCHGVPRKGSRGSEGVTKGSWRGDTLKSRPPQRMGRKVSRGSRRG
jgi:hypothetical protein